jgi:hypothetical protein
MAMLISGLGSLLTRQHATAALNAGAKVLEAYHNGDQEAANAAFASWKVRNQNMLAQYTAERDTYLDIMKDIDRREDETVKDYERRIKGVEGEMRAAISQYRDTVMEYTFDQHGLQASRTFAEQGKKAADTATMNAARLDAAQAYRVERAELLKSSAYKAANRAKMEFDLTTKYSNKGIWTEAQKAAAIERRNKNLATSVLGRNYFAAKQNIETIRGLMTTYPDGIPGPVAQAALQDAYTRLINGGMAIRGFQAKMNTEHAGLWDKALIAAAQLGRGGNISPRMAKDMYDIAEQIMQERARDFGQAIDEAKKHAGQQGLEADDIHPDGWNPDDAPAPVAPGKWRPGLPIPPEAIANLKKHPETRHHFDQVFGHGEADRVLGVERTLNPLEVDWSNPVG